uniref:BED-type domain-containing protein n=2 Tax=Nothobranchius TaxID=28779 RepID=A0A1A8MC43_9TELE
MQEVSSESSWQKKTRKYDKADVALGFTMNTVGNEERPICVFCLKTLAADSMESNKLKRHLETLHPSYVNKPLDFSTS